MPGTDITVGALLLVEYERIKDEQKTRVGFRDNLLYATLASTAIVIAGTLNHGQANLLLLLPPASVLLGWTYLVNDEKVSTIGRYIRAEIAPRLSDMVSGAVPVFAWDMAHRADPHRRARKILQLVVDLSTFCVTPLTALVIFWSRGPRTTTFIVVSILEAAALAILAAQIALYADLSRYPQNSRISEAAMTVRSS